MQNWCRIYASVNKVIIALGNGFVPDRCPPIAWNMVDLLVIVPFRINLWNMDGNTIIFIQENAFQNVISKIMIF